MPNDQSNIPGAENPDELTGLRKTEIKKVAAGIPAVVSTFQKTISEAGVQRGMKALFNLNKKGGFDCPSCAWPDPDDERSGIAEYCENGARAVAEEATLKKLDASFFAQNSVESLGKLSDYEIGGKGRIAAPMFLPAGAQFYQPISWKSAFEKIALELNRLKSPDEAIFYTSGRTSNEAAFLYQLFVREFGTNNLPDCSNMCHESSGVALGESLGIGKGSVKLDDFYEAEVIMILGQNPGTNHPRMLTALQKAKANGATIISINPLPETGLMGFNNPQTVQGIFGTNAALTDIFLQVKINGDLALLKAIEILLLKEEESNPGMVFDRNFIANNTEGYNDFIAHLKEQNAEELARLSGISTTQVQQVARVLAGKSKIIACWAMGLTQHKNAVDTIKEIVNLLLLKGSIGKPGAGTCPVRGHSNVQGDRTMGIFEKPSEKFLHAIERNFHFITPKKHGYDVVESIKAMHEGKAKVFFAMGGNFLSATPDTRFTAEALSKCRLTVHVSTKLNRSHLVTGEQALILPCLGRSDMDMHKDENRFISCENSMGVIQLSKGVLSPVSDQLLSEPVIVCKLAKAVLGRKTQINWDIYAEDYDVIRADIERTIPGFENYNERVRMPGGFYLPNCNREGYFDTLSQKAHFNIGALHNPELKDNELMMMTIRSHDQFNTTIYGLNDRYRGIHNERRVILMNENDIAKRNLKGGDVVDLYNHYDGIERVAYKFVVVPYPIPEGCTATYFPETNVLVPINSVADKSNTPTSKMVILTIRKHLNAVSH
ncbi:FdhF/YdeP family oxidoreductase [Dyadobacter chenwenxiniae]|uniref:FdhF/YdeP family oxidoreductase n=1 Tax=Dyadobacter chenwenxiniae TaxID=2906456 RepID=A0A9X1TG43_9BACT|nr:FdhF/YdeP family oxidoreductase [Dyadobacter chenwenxiniae]MCF0065051.1 FdhF/YdeP family oxidoreductase [Dyadobacter chenwenxiniae]UON83166.1 FdhF/YdeP family oxidoreductase [Dyadobacter chenwenxiniae]